MGQPTGGIVKEVVSISAHVPSANLLVVDPGDEFSHGLSIRVCSAVGDDRLLALADIGQISEMGDILQGVLIRVLRLAKAPLPLPSPLVQAVRWHWVCSKIYPS